MFGPYSEYPLFYDKKRNDTLLDWEYSGHRANSLHRTSEREYLEQMVREAEYERTVMQSAQGTSRTGRAVFDIGASLIQIGCRLEKAGFGRLRAQPVNVTVDCGC